MRAVVVTGGREYDRAEGVRAWVMRLPHRCVVHVGCARGLDRLVRRACEDYGVPYVRHVADWECHGRSAGVRRDRRMVLAAVAAGAKELHVWPGGRGTRDCEAQGARLGLRVVYHDGAGVRRDSRTQGALL